VTRPGWQTTYAPLRACARRRRQHEYASGARGPPPPVQSGRHTPNGGAHVGARAAHRLCFVGFFFFRTCVAPAAAGGGVLSAAAPASGPRHRSAPTPSATRADHRGAVAHGPGVMGDRSAGRRRRRAAAEFWLGRLPHRHCPQTGPSIPIQAHPPSKPDSVGRF